ncbi:glycosyl hydrolase [Maribellus maritimus]|uniref:glycosyl hydrolase n=1 Tax=Maribellus maritimus TaxID=2870838 RepID=UPI001EEA637E|nr:glycosyl hydrolase [Maribellus maritimus]MCG6190493.1 hypothetical protein [Maribellus maritimus]
MKTFKTKIIKQIPFMLVLLAFFWCTHTPSPDADVNNLITENCEWSEVYFKETPHSAKTQVWYHWLNGNLTKEGITTDLESMKASGIGGFSVFNAAEGTPPGSVIYYSDEWWKMFIHTKKEAKRLGLEMGVMNGPGWSASGGPWNTPENAMQEVVWTEKQLKGPLKFDEKLSIPKPALGLERDMKRDTIVNLRYYMPRDYVRGYYHDIALLAFPTPKGEIAGKPYRIDGWWEKAGYSKMARYIKDKRQAPPEDVVKMNDMIDLTDNLDEDGNLQWDVPEGDWTILRVGYQPTGRSNHPAPKGGKGLEVDKMSAAAVDFHWKESVKRMLVAGKEGEKSSIASVTIDSYEAGHQNWTKGFENNFNKMRGYDIRKYLPAITGRVVESTDFTEKFLWDFRKTVSDMIIKNYYKRFQTLAHDNGVRFVAEGYGNFGNTNDFASGKYIDIPASEFWANSSSNLGGIAKLSSSSAHTYGRKIVGAEAFTGSPGKIFETNPRDIKAQGDWFYCKGINQFWLHGYANSPFRQEPGLLLGSYGSLFNRHNTWWKYAKPWFDYMARCQYMLQAGNPKSDVLYYVGEDAPVDPELREDLHPSVPYGYDYDFCNRDILEAVKVKDGKLVLPNGLEYVILVVMNSDHARPEVLKTLEKLINEGAVVVANKPTCVPGLNNADSALAELQILTSRIWGKSDGEIKYKNSYGKGTVYASANILDACADCNLLPDFDFTLDDARQYEGALFPGNGVEFIHRSTAQTDMYFVSNQHNRAKTIKAKFRVADKLPELWDAETGEIIIAPEYQKLVDGRMEVTLRMKEAGSVFVVFRQAIKEESANNFTPAKKVGEYMLTTPWNVSFDGSGAPEPLILRELVDLAKYDEANVKYFSGTITYENKINIDELNQGEKMILDLGEVNVAAEVFVNGKSVGVLWKRPFVIDITGALKTGENALKINVANLWVNRVIGDQELPEDCEWTTNTGSTAKGMGLAKIPDWVIEGKESPTGRKAFVGWKWEHLKNKELVPSGLIGPVQLISKVKVEVR